MHTQHRPDPSSSHMSHYTMKYAVHGPVRQAKLAHRRSFVSISLQFCLLSPCQLDEMTKSMKESLPDWVVVGESILIRPYNSSGVIGFVGTTHFQVSLLVLKLNKTQLLNSDSYSICRPAHGWELSSIHQQARMMELFKAFTISIVVLSMAFS